MQLHSFLHVLVWTPAFCLLPSLMDGRKGLARHLLYCRDFRTNCWVLGELGFQQSPFIGNLWQDGSVTLNSRKKKNKHIFSQKKRATCFLGDSEAWWPKEDAKHSAMNKCPLKKKVGRLSFPFEMAPLGDMMGHVGFQGSKGTLGWFLYTDTFRDDLGCQKGWKVLAFSHNWNLKWI